MKASSENNKICLLNGRDRSWLFWRDFEDFMIDAADYMKIELSIYRAESNRFKQINLLKEIVTYDHCQAIITRTLKNNGKELLEIAEDAQKPLLFVTVGLPQSLKNEFKQENIQFNHWIGEVLPNDEYAGYQLAEHLVADAAQKKLDFDGMYNILAMPGERGNTASDKRLKGLLDLAKERDNVNILRVVHNNGQDIEEVATRTTHLLNRFPQVSAIWAYNDQVAIGVAEGIKKLDRKVLTAGIDWSQEAIDRIKKDEIAFSIGGHSMHGAWGLIIAYDYLNGYRAPPKLYQLPMNKISKDNYLALENFLKAKQVEFDQYSKVKNSHLQDYDFTLEVLRY